MKDTLHNGDFLNLSKKLEDNSIDLAVCDPPYNLSKGGKWKWDKSKKLPGFGGEWNKVMQNWDDMSFAEYTEFTIAWLKEVKRVVKPEGSIWIHGTYHNIGIVNFVLQMLETEIINEITWFKRNSFPNLSGRRLTASHETILWAHTGNKERKYFFNYEYSKKFFDKSDLLKKENKQMRTVWDIPNNKKTIETKYGKHPTQKPMRLIERMIKLSCPLNEGKVLLSPFCGSGTDVLTAKKLGLSFIAYEIDKTYFEITQKRLKDFSQLNIDYPLAS